MKNRVGAAGFSPGKHPTQNGHSDSLEFGRGLGYRDALEHPHLEGRPSG